MDKQTQANQIRLQIDAAHNEVKRCTTNLQALAQQISICTFEQFTALDDRVTLNKTRIAQCQRFITLRTKQLGEI